MSFRIYIDHCWPLAKSPQEALWTLTFPKQTFLNLNQRSKLRKNGFLKFSLSKTNIFFVAWLPAHPSPFLPPRTWRSHLWEQVSRCSLESIATRRERSGAEVRSWGRGGKTWKNDATGIGWVPNLTIVFWCFLWKIILLFLLSPTFFYPVASICSSAQFSMLATFLGEFPYGPGHRSTACGSQGTGGRKISRNPG